MNELRHSVLEESEEAMRFGTIMIMLFGMANGLNAQRLEVGTFVMMQGGAEVTREAYRFDGRVLLDTTAIPSRGIRLESAATYDSVYSPVSLELDIFLGSDQIPSQQVSVSFGDSSASWTARTTTGDSSGVTHLENPYAFMQNLVFAQLAVVLLKYDQIRGGMQRLRVWMPELASALDMDIEFASTTVGEVRIVGTVMNVEVDENGWLLRATVPAQNVVIVREDAVRHSQ